MHIRWTPERLQVLAADLADMKSVVRLADKYGLPYQNIAYAVRKARECGIVKSLPERRLKWTDERLLEVYRELKASRSGKEAAKNLGMCYAQVYRMLRTGDERGLFDSRLVRGRKKNQQFTDGRWGTEALRQLGVEYQETKSLEVVGKKHGITRERVRQLLNKGRELGLCAYSPRWRMCEAVRRLPEAIQSAESIHQVVRALGYKGDCVSRKKFWKQIGVERQVVKTIRENKRRRLIDAIIRASHQVGAPEINSTLLQRHYRSLYSRADREFGGIAGIRKAAAKRRAELLRLAV